MKVVEVFSQLPSSASYHQSQITYEVLQHVMQVVDSQLTEMVPEVRNYTRMRMKIVGLDFTGELHIPCSKRWLHIAVCNSFRQFL